MRLARRSRVRLLVFFLVLLAPRLAHATAVGCRTFAAGGVYLNHCSNHDYYARTEPIALRLAAEGLEVLRTRLVNAGRLANRPVLVELPWAQQPNEAFVEDRMACSPDVGDTDATPSPLGRCYHIDVAALPHDWATFRTALVAATVLTKASPRLALHDLAAVEKRVAASAHRDVEVTGESYASPQDGFAVHERWRDGKLSFVLRRGVHQRLVPTLRGNVAATPRWSADGTTLYLVSLEEVMAYRARDGRVRRFDVSARLPKKSSHLETRIRVTADHVDIAADTALLSEYEIWRWTPETNAVSKPATIDPPQSW